MNLHWKPQWKALPLQHMHAALAEGQIGRVAHSEYAAADGAVIGQLDQRIAHHDVVVLIRAHEAGQHQRQVLISHFTHESKISFLLNKLN